MKTSEGNFMQQLYIDNLPYKHARMNEILTQSQDKNVFSDTGIPNGKIRRSVT